MPIYKLIDELIFPPVSEAEDGIVAIGGDLSPERLMLAYQSGIFPWYSEGDPIVWWSPDPRCVLLPEKLHISRSMQRVLSKKLFEITFNQDFHGVIENCKRIFRKGITVDNFELNIPNAFHDDSYDCIKYHFSCWNPFNDKS